VWVPLVSIVMEQNKTIVDGNIVEKPPNDGDLDTDITIKQTMMLDAMANVDYDFWEIEWVDGTTAEITHAKTHHMLRIKADLAEQIHELWGGIDLDDFVFTEVIDSRRGGMWRVELEEET